MPRVFAWLFIRQIVSSIGQTGWPWRKRFEQLEHELERDEAQELPMPLRPESVGDGGADEPEEHEQLSAGTAGRGRDAGPGLSATRAGAKHGLFSATGSSLVL